MNFEKPKTIYDPLFLSYEQIEGLSSQEILNTLATLSNEIINVQNNINASQEEKDVLKQMRNDPEYKMYLRNINETINYLQKSIKNPVVNDLGINKDARLFLKGMKYLNELKGASDEDVRDKILKMLNYFENKKRTA